MKRWPPYRSPPSPRCTYLCKTFQCPHSQCKGPVDLKYLLFSLFSLQEGSEWFWLVSAGTENYHSDPSQKPCREKWEIRGNFKFPDRYIDYCVGSLLPIYAWTTGTWGKFIHFFVFTENVKWTAELDKTPKIHPISISPNISPSLTYYA